METLFVAEHVNRARASALALEIERRRSLADRGVTLRPEPPFVGAVRRFIARLHRPFARRTRATWIPAAH